MAEVLSAFNRSTGVGELVTVEKIAALYAHISPVEIERSVVIIEHADDGMVGYGPTAEDDTP